MEIRVRKESWLLLILFLSSWGTLQAQYKWENPQEQASPVIRGRAWQSELQGTYARLPLKAQSKVRTPLWDLSQQSAGLSVAFYSNSPEIKIKYVTKGNRGMAHMPATGVSGVDLYATDRNGRSRWCAGKYSFGDTITYTYNGLTYEDGSGRGYEYELFLPLYNSVSFMQIGVRENAFIDFLPVSQEKPLVIYGTSIAQGACASRPGMAWGNIINRELKHPVINLGFSGNGKMEKEIFELLSEIDARLYIIDCMPNMANATDSTVIYNRTLDGVNMLRAQSDAPVLLVEHSGYMNEYTSEKVKSSYKMANTPLRRAYENLIKNKVADIYYLTKEDIGLSMDAMVEGVHPSDLGMQQYADSYIRKIREILHEEGGNSSACIPCKQQRDPYDWTARHEQILDLNRKSPPEILMIGNSITHYWAGKPLSDKQSGKEAWEKLFKGRRVHNLGFGWDKTENVLWRIYHGELDGFQAKTIFLLIGTNNLQFNTDREILDAIMLITKSIRNKQPAAKLYIIGLLPRKDMEERVRRIDSELKGLVSETDAVYIDLIPSLINKEGRIDLSLFSDGLHPNEKGYERIASVLSSFL